MSIYVITEVFEHSRSKGNARLVMIAMADGANADTGESTFGEGLAAVCEIAGVSKSTAKRQIASLIEAEELVLLEQGSGRGHFSRWRVNVGRYRQSLVSVDGDTLNLVDQEGVQIEPLSTSQKGSEGGHKGLNSEPLPGVGTTSSSIDHTPVGGKSAAAADSDPEVPRPYHRTWGSEMVDVWIGLKGGAVTKATKARWIRAAVEFCLAIDARMPDDFLPRAHREGVNEPGGWDAFRMNVYAPQMAPPVADQRATPDWLLDVPAGDPPNPDEIDPEFRRFLENSPADEPELVDLI